MRERIRIPGGFFLWAAAAALLLAVASCKKINTEQVPPQDQAILFPYQLGTTIQDQATLMARSFIIDSRQTKWITYTTKSGLNGIIQFDGNTGDVFPNATSSLPLQFGTVIMAHTEDDNGGVYFTSNSGDYFHFRLFRYRAGTWNVWEISGIPCRELYFNKNDGHLYFIYQDQVHKAPTNIDFSDVSKYQKINFELPGDPVIIRSNFDGKEIHLLSVDRYYVINAAGEILFYTTKFNDISFNYIYASDTATSIFTLGGPSSQHLYKLHEGRWARYPLSNSSLSSITVDRNDELYVTAAEPDHSVGKYTNGEIAFFNYGDEGKRVMSSAPVVVDDRNVKWVAAAEGLIRLP
jgi:hypothetical protein